MSNPRDTPREQDRARTAVAGWRAANPGGTVEQMLAAIGADFHKDFGPLLRGTLSLIDNPPKPKIAGTAPGTAAAR